MVLLCVLGIVACGGGDTTNNYTVPAVPAQSGKSVVVLETAKIDSGLQMYKGQFGSGNQAQMLRVQVSGGALVTGITLALANDVDGDGYSGITNWSVPGVGQGFNEHVDETVDGGQVIISATIHNQDYRLTSFAQGALVRGAVILQLDTKQFIGLDEFFVDIVQSVPGGFSFEAIRLVPNPYGGCGATGVIVEGSFDQSIIRIFPSQISIFYPPVVPPDQFPPFPPPPVPELLPPPPPDSGAKG